MHHSSSRDSMSWRRQRVCIAAVLIAGAIAWSSRSALASGTDVLRIKGDIAKARLGDGTNVIVGIVDSGVDDLHPALTGTDSLGRPRMVAEANYVTTEPANTGDDIYGHGTAVMGVIGLRSASSLAIATDARYINARCLDSNNSFSTDAWAINAAGFAVTNGANLINMSLGYFNANTSGNSTLSLMADYITYNRRIPMTISAGNSGTAANHLPQGPGDAYNVFSLGATGPNSFGQITTFSSYGPTTDGRSKPDLAAPGQSILTANNNWEGGTQFNSWSGTSFAAPNTAGMLAAQMEAGQRWGYSRDPLVLKATMMNSAEKVTRRDGTAWRAIDTPAASLSFTTPLDRDSGAGQIDGQKLSQQYAPGNIAPQGVGVALDPVGWNFNTISSAGTKDYDLGIHGHATPFTATLTWYRKVGYTDSDSSGTINAGDSFPLLATPSNLSLELYNNGTLISQSISSGDNVEHISIPVCPDGNFVIKVRSASASSDEFALAWYSETSKGDFNSDGVVNAVDIDKMMFATAGAVPTGNPRFDLNDDFNVINDANLPASDADNWVHLIKLTEYGDTNLDKVIDFTDLLALAQNYGATTAAGWAKGSFDGDGAVDFNDLLTLSQHYGFGSLVVNNTDFTRDWALAQTLVPEPGMVMAIMLLVPAIRRR